MKHIPELQKLVSKIGGRIFPVDQYAVVEVGCDRWTFRNEHQLDMIKNTLKGYL